MHSRRRWIIGALVAIVAALYLSGRLDYALYNVGLNFRTCARNGFGATFCGSDLTAYQTRINGVQQQIQTITSSESAAQQSIAQQMCQADPNSSLCSSP